MALIRPRLNDFYDLPFRQEQVSFAIPLLDSDVPLYVDPFLLWKSPSQQDQALHTAMITSINQIGRMYSGDEAKAVALLIGLSECPEVGLGTARNRHGKRIGDELAQEILSLFKTVPQIERGGLPHLEVVQLLVDQVGRDRISDHRLIAGMILFSSRYRSCRPNGFWARFANCQQGSSTGQIENMRMR